MSTPEKFIDSSTGKEFEIPPDGSLGLLALGDVTVKPWRQKRIDTGYEADLREKVKKFAEEVKKRRAEIKQKIEERKKEKELQEQKKNEQSTNEEQKS